MVQKFQQDYQIQLFEMAGKWESWLKNNHTRAPGIWVKIAKKASGITSVTYDDALEIALCYGWIDGQRKSMDEQFYIQKFTPRGKRSIWSKRNREIVDRLIAENRMREAGYTEIAAAKADGRWDAAYDSPKNMAIPEDFLRELSKNKKAEAFFNTLNKTNTYAIAWRLQTAKKPETRERRMKVLLRMLSEEQKFH